jgi:hypothetical protein
VLSEKNHTLLDYCEIKLVLYPVINPNNSFTVLPLTLRSIHVCPDRKLVSSTCLHINIVCEKKAKKNLGRGKRCRKIGGNLVEFGGS